MKLIKILLLFCFVSCLGQVKNGTVEYGLSIEMLEGLRDNGPFKKLYSEAVNNAQYLTFNLLFDKQNSFFSLNKGLEIGENNNQLAIVASGYKGVIYQTKDFALSELDKSFGNFLLKNELYEWTLVNETKEIQGFLCYKATAIKTIINTKGNFKFPVIAWYCPKIPLSFGPNGFGNLPGLILELQVRNVLFGVKKIEMNLNNPPVLPKIKEYKIIDEKELEKMIAKISDFKN